MSEYPAVDVSSHTTNREPTDTAAADVREALAAYAHEAWSGWMIYLFSRTTVEHNGDIRITHADYERWRRQMTTAYADLPESEKESDRAEADKMLAIVGDMRPSAVALSGAG